MFKYFFFWNQIPQDLNDSLLAGTSCSLPGKAQFPKEIYFRSLLHPDLKEKGDKRF